MKISELTQRIAIALLIITGATALSCFIIGQYDPNQWPDSVRLSFGIGIILTIVVIVMHHKAQQREMKAREKEKAQLERERGLEEREKEQQRQAVLNSMEWRLGNAAKETVIRQMGGTPTLPPIQEEEAEH